MFGSNEAATGFACGPMAGGGYTWSYASLLGALLHRAEELFGERDLSYTVLGVEFVSSGGPQVWYPGNRRHIVVQLTDSARLDQNRGLFQLAHEVVHLLAPSGGRHANVAEEGIASLFSDAQSTAWGSTYRTNGEKYPAAMALARVLYDQPGLIRTLRLKRPAMFEWTESFLVEEAAIAAPMARMLCLPFSELEFVPARQDKQ